MMDQVHEVYVSHDFKVGDFDLDVTYGNRYRAAFVCDTMETARLACEHDANDSNPAELVYEGKGSAGSVGNDHLVLQYKRKRYAREDYVIATYLIIAMPLLTMENLKRFI